MKRKIEWITIPESEGWPSTLAGEKTRFVLMQDGSVEWQREAVPMYDVVVWKGPDDDEYYAFKTFKRALAFAKKACRCKENDCVDIKYYRDKDLSNCVGGTWEKCMNMKIDGETQDYPDWEVQ